MSSPRESSSNPMNCSQRLGPKHSLMLLNICTATILLSSLSSSWAISMTCFNTKSLLSWSFKLWVIYAISLAANSLTLVILKVLRAVGSWGRRRGRVVASFWCSVRNSSIFWAGLSFRRSSQQTISRFNPCLWSECMCVYNLFEEGFE